ncbi:MAG TPA: LPS assembly lipoprotein LptE [Thermodesulfovibrionales bacterium]|nr:LPS assembly lipoprotein LptE [Thermodesulfovibrionales bacterium]
MRTGHRAEGTGRGENKKRAYGFLRLPLCTLLIAFCFAGCGYTLYGKADLPFPSIAIDKIVNKTFEPRLEDRMQVALVDELMKSGFRIDAHSGHRIVASLTTFELTPLSTRAGVAIEYEVKVMGVFTLVDPSGNTRPLRNHGVFIVSFPSTAALQGVIALKEQATETALRDLSIEVIASIIYGGP